MSLFTLLINTLIGIPILSLFLIGYALFGIAKISEKTQKIMQEEVIFVTKKAGKESIIILS